MTITESGYHFNEVVTMMIIIKLTTGSKVVSMVIIMILTTLASTFL